MASGEFFLSTRSESLPVSSGPPHREAPVRTRIHKSTEKKGQSYDVKVNCVKELK